MATGLENLKIYTMARDLEIQVYKITKEFPAEEKYRTIDQLRRSSSSVVNNIAEAYYKQSFKERVHILKDTVICEAEETRANLYSCIEKELAGPVKLNNIISGYTNFMKATHGYIRFLKTSQLKRSVTS